MDDSVLAAVAGRGPESAATLPLTCAGGGEIELALVAFAMLLTGGLAAGAANAVAATVG